MSSRPAIRRSSVDLPQPEGPTKTTNSLGSISRSTPLMTWTGPKDLVTWRMVIAAMGVSLFEVGEGEAPGRQLDRAAVEAGALAGEAGVEHRLGVGDGSAAARRRG